MAIMAAAVLTLDVIWLRVRIGGETATKYFTDLLPLVLTLVAAAACRRAARGETGRARRGWLLLGAGVLSWGAGEATWSFYELVQHREVPFPSFADVGFLGMIPLAVAGLLCFPHAPTTIASRFRAVIDALVLPGSVLFISWATVLGPTLRDGTGSVFARAVGVAYPLGDVVLITIVLGFISRIRRSAPLILIACGLAALAFADSGFLYLTQHDAYTSGNLIGLGWDGGFMLIGLGALRFAPASAQPVAREHPSIWIPYGSLFLAIAAGGAVEIQRGFLPPFLFWNALVMVLLVLTRTVLTMHENSVLARTLESSVAERTAELEAALEQIGQSRRLQDAFIASVSHELRTPLTNMIGAARTLMRPELGLADQARDLVAVAERGVMRMSRLVEDLLITSALSDDTPGERSPFDAVAEVRGALEHFSAPLKTVYVSAPQSLVAIGDGARFRVVLEHLLRNAAQHSPPRTGIWITVFPRGGNAEIVVRDEGPGIPPGFHAKVFERFFQIDGSSTREHAGAGLGLFVARTLAEGMGGSLKIDPTNGMGASLRFTLPAVPSVTDASPTTDDPPTSVEPLVSR